MSALEKVRDGFFEHLGTAAALLVTGLIGWLSIQLAPLLAPLVEKALPARVVLGVLGLSVFLNIGLAVALWRAGKEKPAFRLKYGILWDRDKNPHCPVCKNAGLDYNEWNYGQLGYHCNGCAKVFALKDATGKDIKPADAIAAL